jgi:hypothetical protein
MVSDHTLQRYRNWYAKLLRLYPKAHRERFGEGMEQTFNDLCRERVKAERGLFSFALWMFFETSAGIMSANMTFIIMQKSIIRVALGTGLILLIPLFGNLFVDGWNWPLPAFILAGTLLFGTGLTYELVAKKMNNKAYRFAVGLVVGTAFILTWMNLAVGGILGDHPANLMYPGVLLVGFIGAIIARLEPHGMSRALFAMAFAMALVPLIALIVGAPAFANGVVAVFGLHAFFAMLWVVSALLFRRASANRL